MGALSRRLLSTSAIMGYKNIQPAKFGIEAKLLLRTSKDWFNQNATSNTYGQADVAMLRYRTANIAMLLLQRPYPTGDHLSTPVSCFAYWLRAPV